MKTRMQILVTSLILLSMMTSLSAQAGILDWFKSNDAMAEQASGGSFDSLYASVLGVSKVDDEDLMLMAHAMAPVHSSTSTSKKTTRTAYAVQVSGYNSEIGQTDDSPFITANGSHVRDGIVASNMFPFHTIIRFKNCGDIPEDKLFMVEDRMNTRYQRNVDIWFAEKADALALGRRTCQIEVIK